MKRLLVGLLGVGLVLGSARHAPANMVLEFDGNDRVTLPNSESLNPSEITVECRVNFARLAIDWPNSGVRCQELIGKGADETSGSYHLRQNRGGPNLQFQIGEVGHGWNVEALAPLEISTWYHVAGTYDGTTIRVYLDGDLIGSELFEGLTIGNAEPVYFAHHDYLYYEYPLAGQMDDVRIWNYARTESQIQATMGAGTVTGSEPGLVGYWNFNEALASQTVLDLTSNGNHGHLGSTMGVDGNDPTRVPEPSTLVLLGMGAVGLSAYAWRKRRRP